MQDPIPLCESKKLSRSPSITTDLGYYTLVPSQILPTHSRNSISHNTSKCETHLKVIRFSSFKPNSNSLLCIQI